MRQYSGYDISEKHSISPPQGKQPKAKVSMYTEAITR
ncbi:hypothetical protein ALQ67_200025 [Pseudomonas savastanoi pv. glycinea]|nr:hypothetical protein ALQ67_200025 [Pseudomonas savastanoi pv. glycinea]